MTRLKTRRQTRITLTEYRAIKTSVVLGVVCFIQTCFYY